MSDRHPVRPPGGGSWTAGMTPRQQRWFEEMAATRLSEWPPGQLDELNQVLKDWGMGRSGDVTYEAIAYMSRLHVRD